MTTRINLGHVKGEDGLSEEQVRQLISNHKHELSDIYENHNPDETLNKISQQWINDTWALVEV